MPNDENAKLIKGFLIKNKLLFSEIETNDINVLKDVCQGFCFRLESLVRVKYSHNINIIRGFDEYNLNQLLEHIKKYNPKLK